MPDGRDAKLSGVGACVQGSNKNGPRKAQGSLERVGHSSARGSQQASLFPLNNPVHHVGRTQITLATAELMSALDFAKLKGCRCF